MKIAILGAGISGFSAYLFLKKHFEDQGLLAGISIIIYEAYDIHTLSADVTPLSDGTSDEPAFTPVAVGNALGISKNGLKVLQRLDPDGDLLNRVKRRGNPVSCWRMRNARGWTLANINSTSSQKGAEGHGERADSGAVDLSLMIARQDLWEVLRDQALKEGGIVVKKRVDHVIIGDAANKRIIRFDDGTDDEADLIIGADGLRSSLRRAISERKEAQVQQKQQGQQEQKSWDDWFAWLRSPFQSGPAQIVDYVTPHFEGLISFGGFLPTEELQGEDGFDSKTMNFVFGPNGFFGCACVSSTAAVSILPERSQEARTGSISTWWSTFSSPVPYPYRHQVQSTGRTADTPTYIFDNTTALDDLLSRHRTWADPVLRKTLQYAAQTGLSSNNFYPSWTTPELPVWQKNGVAVLIGDAAHTLPTTSGQGASQALEDAEALAMFLSYYLTQVKGQNEDDTGRICRTTATATATATALEKFELLRKPRVRTIRERSQRMASKKTDMGFIQEMIMYLAIWLTTFFHDTFNDTIVNYDLPREVMKVVAQDS